MLVFLVPKPRLFPRSQAPAFSSFPSPCLGTHLLPKPGLRSVSRHGKPGNLPGNCVPKQGLGNEKSRGLGTRIEYSLFQFFPRSQAPAWERICSRSPGFGPSPVTGSRGTSPASAFPSRGLGTRNEYSFFQFSILFSEFPLSGEISLYLDISRIVMVVRIENWEKGIRK